MNMELNQWQGMDPLCLPFPCNQTFSFKPQRDQLMWWMTETQHNSNTMQSNSLSGSWSCSTAGPLSATFSWATFLLSVGYLHASRLLWLVDPVDDMIRWMWGLVAERAFTPGVRVDVSRPSPSRLQDRMLVCVCGGRSSSHLLTLAPGLKMVDSHGPLSPPPPSPDSLLLSVLCSALSFCADVLSSLFLIASAVLSRVFPLTASHSHLGGCLCDPTHTHTQTHTDTLSVLLSLSDRLTLGL